MSQVPDVHPRGVVKSPVDLAAGLSLVALGAIAIGMAAWLGAWVLIAGVPIVLAGLALVVVSLALEGGLLDRVVKSQLDLGGGLFLLVLAMVGLAGGFNLPTGTLSGIGSGLMPRAVSVLVAAFGVLLIVQSFLLEGDRLERWHLRGPVFILGAVLVFALLIRGSTLSIGGFLGIPLLATIKVPGLGLIIAGPLAVIVSAYADRDTRFLEVLWFSVVMTLLCGFLFKEVLNLPIPYDPLGLIPEPIDEGYAAIRSGFVHVFEFVKSFFVR